MAHLDDDVAAYVDGQLAPSAQDAARRHLQDCARCEEAVRAQRRLKERMSRAGDVAPPAALLAALVALPKEAPETVLEDPWWRRATRPGVWGAALVLIGASLVVVGAAYALGGPSRSSATLVSPPVERYVEEFATSSVSPQLSEAEPTSIASAATGSVAGFVRATDELSPAEMARLSANGWPCHPRLGDDLHREAGVLEPEAGTVSVSYTDGARRLVLHEHDGTLDPDAVPDLEQRRVGEQWVRLGERDGLRVAVWDAEGVAYTLVTDLREDRLAEVLGELPSGSAPHGIGERVGAGLARVSDWLTPS